MDRDGVLIIGYGSVLRGDDAAGLAAARELAFRGFRTIAVHQLTPDLAEPVSSARAVVFLDASCDLPAGEIRMTQLSEKTGGAAPVEHTTSPEELLRIARLAYGTAPEACMISLGVESFEIGEPLSPKAEAAVARALELILCPA